MDWVMYWFMFPVSMGVATTAMLSGIGGAALFMPIFLIIFPMIGPEYTLAGPAAAIGVALITETFGFSSGFVGYYRKRLIDFRMARAFVIFAVPAGIVGALLSHQANPTFLKFAYGAIMFLIAVSFWFGHHQEEAGEADETDTETADPDPGEHREVHARDGKVYKFKWHGVGHGWMPTGVGGLFTGLLSVGIGEIVMPQMARRRIPIAVCAATSILVVIITVMSASFTHVAALINAGGWSAVPWNLVCYTVPAVIIGGQIGPRLQGVFQPRTMEILIASMFTVIGLSMLWITRDAIVAAPAQVLNWL